MWKSHVSTHLTLLPITTVHIWIYPWGCGLTFASNMLWNFDYVLFSHSTHRSRTPPTTNCFSVACRKSKKNWEKCSTYIRSMCACACVSLHNELHSIGFSTALIGLILSSHSLSLVGVRMSGCACTTFQYIKFCRKSWDVLCCGFERLCIDATTLSSDQN